MLLDDLRHSIRSLFARPGFAVVAALTLALGIGSTSTIFSWINATPLDPIPGVARTSDLVSIMRGERSMSPVPPFSYPDYCDIRRSTRSFAGILAYHDTDVVLMNGTTPKPISGMLVSANYVDMLQLQPAIGRFFAPEEEAAEGLRRPVLARPGTCRQSGPHPGPLVLRRGRDTEHGVSPPGRAAAARHLPPAAPALALAGDAACPSLRRPARLRSASGTRRPRPPSRPSTLRGDHAALHEG